MGILALFLRPFGSKWNKAIGHSRRILRKMQLVDRASKMRRVATSSENILDQTLVLSTKHMLVQTFLQTFL